MQLEVFQPKLERIGAGQNQFWFGDMRLRLLELQASYAEKVQLAYMDPPFATGQTFTHKMRTAGETDAGIIPLRGYDDPAFSQTHKERLHAALGLIHKLLAPTGAVVVHVDHRLNAHVRLMLDDIFGPENFVNEIIWAYASGGRATKHFSRKHDTLIVYRKAKGMYFNIQAVGKPRGAQRRNHMKRSVDEDGRVRYSIRSGGRIYTYDEDSLVYPSDVWSDIPHLQQRDPERTGYATQKPQALLERLLKSMAREGDIVLDPCSGSGTTPVVAHRLGMRFIAVDNAELAAHTLRTRLIAEQQRGGKAADAAFLGVPCSEVDVGAQAQAGSGKVRVRLGSGIKTSAQHMAEADAVINYAALGAVEDGAFTPVCMQSRSAVCPGPEWVLEAEQSENLALHVVTADGRQCFWRVKA